VSLTVKEVAVSLQGSLETFGLPDVVGLLAATQKSGELYVAGNRTAGLARMPAVQGRVWFDRGRLASADVAGQTGIVDALVELLWLVEGTFSFRPGAVAAPGSTADAAEVLAQALDRRAEWREIERVLPSRAASLDLHPAPPTTLVTMRADQWRLIVAIAGRASVGEVVARLGLDELPACRGLKEVVEAGLVTVLPAYPSPTTREPPIAVNDFVGAGERRARVTTSAAAADSVDEAPEEDDHYRGAPVVSLLDRLSS
jgi:hypothetical protein